MRYAMMVLTLTVGVVAQDRVDAPIPTEFDVAVIQRNVSSDTSSGGRRYANGQEAIINVSARSLVTQAFPSRGSSTLIGLPSWAEKRNALRHGESRPTQTT
jgi:hypothetical protein